VNGREPAPASATAVCRAFAPELWRERRPLALSVGFSLVAIGAGLVAPLPLRWIIDHAIAGDPLPAPARPLEALHVETLVIGLAALSLGAVAARAVASSVQRIIDARVRERVGLALRDRLLAHAEMLSPAQTARRRSGEVVYRLVTDAQILVRCATKTLPQVFQHGASVLALLLAMAWVSPVLGGVGLLSLPPLFWQARRYGRRLREASRRKRSLEGDLSGFGQEVLRGLPLLQAGDARLRFRGVAAAAQAAGVAETAVGLAMERSLQITQGAIVALVTGVGALLVLRGELSVGALTVCVAYVTQLLKPAEKVNELSSALANGLASGERVLALLADQPHVRDGHRTLVPGATRGRFALKDVWFRHPASERRGWVLEAVDVVFEPGTLVAVAGASGSGKTSLLQLLLRLFDPARGTITLDGTPLPELRLASLRAEIAFVSQQTHLFAGTLREALSLGTAAPGGAPFAAALAAVGLDRFVADLPRGLDSTIGEDGVDLSGGQRQRLALARALLQDRPVLLLDEPTANVDAETEEIVLAALGDLARGRTCVVATHSERLLAHADRVLRLERGRLGEASAPVPMARAAGGAR
jgi:ABC-type multidrug transport system fused ATPase/permease subunit